MGPYIHAMRQGASAMRRGFTLKDSTIDVALPMASLPLSTPASAKWTKPKSKRGSVLRKEAMRNERAREVREFRAKNPLASQRVIAGQFKLQRSTEILYTADCTAEKFHYSTW